MRYQDLFLRIEPTREDTYAVLALSRQGERKGTFRIPFAPGEVLPLPWIKVGRDFQLNSQTSAPTLTPEAVGDRLFGALFHGPVGDLLQDLLDRTRGPADLGVRVRIHLQPEDGGSVLHDLPWELLYFWECRSFLGLSRKSPVVRSISASRPAPPLHVDPPLRILVAAGKLPPGTARLALSEEVKVVEEACSPGVEIVFQEIASALDLFLALQKGNFHVLHYMGHGGFDVVRGMGTLLLGRAHSEVTGPVVAQSLRDLPPLRLVVLNACQTGRFSSEDGLDPYTGIAPALLLAGVPAVVAMRSQISDAAAVAFSRSFYSHLTLGEPVEAAMSEARKLIQATWPESFEWTTPALFLQSATGRLLSPGRESRNGQAPDPLKLYLQWLAERLEEVQPPGVFHGGCRLDSVFMPLHCRPVHPATPRSLAETPFPTFPPFTSEKQIVLLGEAGSGKTTILQWLARTHAQAKLLRKKNALAPAGVNLGRACVPVLVRLDDFARARRQSPALSLTGFLGCHLAPGSSALDAGRGNLLILDDLNARLVRLLETRKALILLDGLDEIVDPGDRFDIVREIDRFLRDWFPPEPSAPPDRGGALRVIVTSRLAGYQASPLGPSFTHWLLEPLDPTSARLFGASWDRALRQNQESPAMPAPPPDDVPEILTSNPRLATLLAVLRSQNPGNHPRHRIDLFAAAVSLLLEDWQQRAGLDGERLLALLAEQAAAQIDSPEARSLNAFLSSHLRKAEAGRAVAALAGQGEHGLLNPAFQEYLAACWLANDRRQAPERILERLGTPRWRESLRMAVGRMSADLSPEELAETLHALLDAVDPFGAILPRVPALIATSLEEMASIPDGIIEKVASRLVVAWAERFSAGAPAALLGFIERTFLRLVETAPIQSVDRALCRALKGDCREQCLAAAHLAHVASRSTVEIAEALEAALPQDSEKHGWPLDTALRGIADRQPNALPVRPGTFRMALRRDPILLQRFQDRPAWRRIGLALYGDSSGPGAMFRDSPLTPMLTVALQEDRSREALAANLWHSAIDSAEEVRADALLALAALGEPVTALFRSADSAVPLALARLSRLSQTLETRVPQAAGPVFQAIQEAAPQLSADRGYDLVATTLNVVLAFGGSPLPVLPLVKAFSAETRPLLLSEVLHGVLADVHGDPIYNLAVLLDTEGETLASPPRLLARTLAAASRSANANWSGHRAWSLDRLAPRNGDDIGTLTQALDALEGLTDAFDFFRGWAITVLASTLREAGLSAEALGFALGRLSDRFDSRPDALRALAGGDIPSVSSLVATARQIDDPFLRFRAFFRLVRTFPDLQEDLLSPLPQAGFLRLLTRLLGAGDDLLASQARGIGEPSLRSRAFLDLAQLDQPDRARWTAAALRAGKRISDPENRARSLARLAPRLPYRKRHRCLAAALRAAAHIADEKQRAETLQALRPSLAASPRLRSRYERAAAELQDPNARARALGLTGSILLLAENDIGQESAPLILGAIVNDLRRELTLPQDIPGLWAALAEPGRHSAALERLLRLGRLQGLRLTAEAAMVLDGLIEEGDLKTVLPLLPQFEAPEPSAGSILERWLVAGLPGARNHAALLLAERDGLSAATLSSLLDLLEAPDDRTRHRAALALHGHFMPGEQPLAVSRLGPSLLEELARRWITLRDRAPGPAKVIQWTFQRIEHDDGDAITKWARQSEESSCVILGNMEWLHPTAEAAFLNLLREGTLRVQQILIRSLCRLLARQRIRPGFWDEILPILRSLTPQAGRAPFLANPPTALLGAVRDAWDESGRSLSPSLPEAAERALSARVQPLFTAFQSEPDTAREILTAAGRASRPSGRSVRTATDRIAASPELIFPLLCWLCARLASDIQDAEPFCPVTSELLTLASAAAERLPVAYLAGIRELPDLSPRLRQAARFHDSFPGRKAALLLLALTGRLTPEILEGLEAGLRDVAPVQSAVLGSLGLYREVDGEALPRLLRNLNHPIPMTAMAAARLLGALSRGGALSPAEQAEVIRALSAAAAGPGSLRDVYVLSEAPPLQLESKGRLDEILYGALMEASGLHGLLDSPEPQTEKP